MPEKIQAIKGMNDVVPENAQQWQTIEHILKRCLSQYAYQEIRLPLLEKTALFKRGIGEITDIVEKEMYTLTDLNGESISLRPEGTASCIRATIEHHLLYNQAQKLWYLGPMFRHERPQKGRYRQFHQLGVEALGFPDTAIELELLSLCKRIWSCLGLDAMIRLEINNIGSVHDREIYKKDLISYLKQNYSSLDEDSQRRLQTNPLRILDSKHSLTQEILKEAPLIQDYLDPKSKDQFENLCKGLESLKINYKINPFLVRGLDYYNDTVFEWVSDQLGSQSAVCAGGRYDSLIAQLGGKPSPAAGFAIGLERLLLLQAELNNLSKPIHPHLYFISSEETYMQATLLAEELRSAHPWKIEVDLLRGSFKSQFKRADKSEAQLALILGEDELRNNQISVKNLRKQEDQKYLSKVELVSYLKSFFAHLGCGD